MLFPYPAVGDVRELQRRAKRYGIISSHLMSLKFSVDDAHMMAVGADGAVITFAVERPASGNFKEAQVPAWRTEGGVRPLLCLFLKPCPPFCGPSEAHDPV